MTHDRRGTATLGVGKLAKHHHTAEGATEIQNLELAFDQAANLRVRKDRSPGVNAGAGIREQYGFSSVQGHFRV